MDYGQAGLKTDNLNLNKWLSTANFVDRRLCLAVPFERRHSFDTTAFLAASEISRAVSAMLAIGTITPNVAISHVSSENSDRWECKMVIKRHPESKATSIPVNINLAALFQPGTNRITTNGTGSRSPFSKRITESPTIHSMGLSCENENN